MTSSPVLSKHKGPNKVSHKDQSRWPFFLTLALGCILGLWFIQLATFLVIPAGSDKIQKIVDVPYGANLRTVAQVLAGEGIVRDPTYFIIAGKLIGVEKAIKPGEYAMHTHMRPLQILDLLKKGMIYQHEVVIPEGYTVKQIAQLLQDKQLADKEVVVKLSREPQFIRSLEIQANSLEGYLFPSTYYIARKTAPEEIIRMMVRAFQQTYTQEFEQRAQALHLTQHQVVTLASIIEKETSLDEERPLVSAVFHNRLRRHIPLQSDPTVIYSLPNFDGNLKRVHLKMSSPYNTYRRTGLPPGPIANPGKAAIYATLYPASVDYLFFVSRNDGTHYFSRSLQEHNLAVSMYQKVRRVKR
jgi:UPF0755 protein